jgi:hypothetical protein
MCKSYKNESEPKLELETETKKSGLQIIGNSSRPEVHQRPDLPFKDYIRKNYK